jgi:hypothetical protein
MAHTFNTSPLLNAPRPILHLHKAAKGQPPSVQVRESMSQETSCLSKDEAQNTSHLSPHLPPLTISRSGLQFELAWLELAFTPPTFVDTLQC